MRELKNTLKDFSKVEWMAVGIFLTSIIVAQISSGSTLISFIAAIMGLLYVTLVRKGSRLCYIFGAIQIILYIFISFQAKFYGDVMLNTFNLCMQPIGWYLWTKRSAKGGLVNPKSLTKKQFGILVVVLVVIWFFFSQFLATLGGHTPPVDALTTIASITAMLLSIQAFRTQWIFWTICNGTSVVMWSIACARGDMSSIPMIIMWCGYFLNGIIGWKEWSKM